MAQRTQHSRRGIIAGAAFLLTCLTGCLSEQSFPMRPGDPVEVSIQRDSGGDPFSARAWLQQVQPQLATLLSPGKPQPLLSDELSVDGWPIDVMKHFGVRPDRLQKLFGNYSGLVHTAQCVGAGFTTGEPKPWPGFEEVWIPVRPDLSLNGWLGLARAGGQADGPPIESNCIVLLPGLLGCHEINRTRELARALLSAGHHVLSIELRGHGQTDAKYPNVYYNFGVIETRDLMIVSEWLDDQPHVRGSGLIGFCWGANHAMIAAWYDGRPPGDPSLSPRLRAIHDPPRPRRHYTAGVMAFSPTLRFEEILELLKTPRSAWREPVYNGLQDILIGRAKFKGYPEQAGDLRALIDREFERSELDYDGAVDEGLTFLRWLPFRDRPAHDKATSIRVPTLIVTAANDPLVGGQELADLMARVKNPNVAALLTPGGGHVGFAAWNRRYYYSLILAFFDPVHGPGAR